jgi:hypothetical protein
MLFYAYYEVELLLRKLLVMFFSLYVVCNHKHTISSMIDMLSFNVTLSNSKTVALEIIMDLFPNFHWRKIIQWARSEYFALQRTNNEHSEQAIVLQDPMQLLCRRRHSQSSTMLRLSFTCGAFCTTHIRPFHWRYISRCC